jgi:hypothetical protein
MGWTEGKALGRNGKEEVKAKELVRWVGGCCWVGGWLGGTDGSIIGCPTVSLPQLLPPMWPLLPPPRCQLPNMLV